MDFLKIILLSLFSLAMLFLITKIMGYRQISELSFFDYVEGITIGSIAAEMSTNIDLEWWKGVTAIGVYGIVGVLLSLMTRKSITARKIISGKPIVLIEQGKISEKSLKKAKIDINDLLASARLNGYFNIADIDCAVMENTGKISFQPTALKRQLNPKDFSFAPEREGLCYNVIIDAKIMQSDLKNAKMTEKQLKNQLKSRGVDLNNVLLATLDINKKLTVFEKGIDNNNQ
ncbi:MAG: DUF421 domain-containing protein [Clostridiales bacterium]|nr:DUF421 domain-containing protein [Clostridiales bacterium]